MRSMYPRTKTRMRAGSCPIMCTKNGVSGSSDKIPSTGVHVFPACREYVNVTSSCMLSCFLGTSEKYAAKWRWHDYDLPYAYCTLKAKCFSSDGSHCCAKPSHSCFRRIVSWRNHLAKAVYRGASRAIMGMISALSAGFETKSLLTAVPDLLHAVASLLSLPSSNGLHSCIKCSKAMSSVSICVCDAAQMYEELPFDRSRESVSGLIAAVQRRFPGTSGVAVLQTIRLHTWLVSGEFRFRGNALVWLWPDIVAVVELALRQPIVRLGNCLFEQVTGAPIGGHLSKAIASAVLAYDELQFCQLPHQSLRVSKADTCTCRCQLVLAQLSCLLQIR